MSLPGRAKGEYRSAQHGGFVMNRLQVHYTGWGESWLLGTLADNGRERLFEYSADALRQGLELSPLRLKLRAQA